MKIILIFIALYFSLISLSYSEIKNCKGHKKNSSDYKICVENNISVRNANFKNWKLSNLFKKNQHKAVKDLGNNIFWIQGYDKKDVLIGGTAHCSKIGGNFLKIKLIPHYPTQVRKATLTFKCQT